ncbi:hypothetical protein CISIN_1g034705mg [Citrus sinensis]|uniref:Uncharacterized protein n=1 Tax=Citrus sinensis TaxID=2711 RepID=A0A067EUU0_CITSI|nr:hypothetical protein CISIN_1g034705mg [Citrus sinensis]
MYHHVIIYVMTASTFSFLNYICLWVLQDAIQIDKDLLQNSARALETLVSVGMRMGVSKKEILQTELPSLEACVIAA